MLEWDTTQYGVCYMFDLKLEQKRTRDYNLVHLGLLIRVKSRKFEQIFSVGFHLVPFGLDVECYLRMEIDYLVLQILS